MKTYRNFRNRSDEEDTRKKEHEASNAEVDPLNRLETVAVLTANVLEEYERSEDPKWY